MEDVFSSQDDFAELDLNEVEYADSLEKRTEECQQTWSRTTSNEVWRKWSHWKDYNGGWKRIGKRNIDQFLKFSRFARTNNLNPIICNSNDSYEDHCAVEWGVGGGANAVVFAPMFKKFYGVDVSAATLDECSRVMAGRGLSSRFESLLIEALKPHEVIDRIPKCFLFLSTATFQHFPGIDYTAKIIDVASRLLIPNGVALIQFRYNDDSSYYRPKLRNYAKHKNAIRFTSLKIRQFVNMSGCRGFRILHCAKMGKANYVYCFMDKPG